MTNNISYIESTRSRKIRALVVDDNMRSARLLSDCLSSLPRVLVVGTFFDGQLALEEALILRPELVVTDLNMPVLGGLELTKQLLHQLSDVRVVITSIHNGRETEAAVRLCGGHYIPKSRFVEEVSGFIDREFPQRVTT